MLKPGDRLVSVDGVRGDATALGTQIATHKCAGTPSAGCKAAKAVRIRFIRDGRTQTVTAVPRYDETVKRSRLGFSSRPITSRLARSTQSARAARRCGESPRLPPMRSPASSTTRRRERGNLRRGRAPRSRTTAKSFEFDWAQALNVLAIISLSLALVEPLPVPSARRRPHLLGAGGEGPREAGGLRGDGTRERRRIRPRPDAFCRRPVE